MNIASITVTSSASNFKAILSEKVLSEVSININLFSALIRAISDFPASRNSMLKSYFSENLLLSFSRYLTAVFNTPFDFETDIPISSTLYYALKRTKYISSTGKTRYIKRLAEDIKEFYSETGIGNIATFSQIQKALLGYIFDFSVICQIAFYLDIDISDLISPKLTEDQVNKEKAYHYSKEQIPNWMSYDKEIAPALEQRVKEIYYGTPDKRPERVSKRILYQEFNLSDHRLEKLPACRAIFDRHTETYEENWARRIIWAYKKLKAERNSRPFYWSDIRSLAGVKKINIDKVIPFIAKHSDLDTYKDILSLLKSNNK